MSSISEKLDRVVMDRSKLVINDLSSSSDDFELFFRGHIWADLKNTISELIDGCRNDLETCTSQYDIASLQGEIRAYRMILQLEESLIYDLKLTEEKGEEEDV